MDDKTSYSNTPASSENRSLDEALRPPGTRMADHNLLGQTTNAGKIGDVVSGYPASTNLGTGTSLFATIADASSTSFNFTVSDNFGRVILAVPDIAIYVDGVARANQWPNASYGMGNMPITSFNDWGQTNNINVTTRVVVRNNSGGSRDVLVVVRFRIITNSTDALSGLTVGSVTQ